MSDTTYNGWTNYETWCIQLWLNNDSTIQWFWENEARHCWESAEATRYHTREEEATFELARRLKDAIEQENPLVGEASMFSDLLSAAISEVNWHEIAQAYLEDIDKDN